MNTARLIKRKEIDEQKWDNCVAQSSNSLPYAFSWYLDAVAENWDGLVINNYESVFPVVWLRKFGIKCLYQPYYCQQLGVFGKDVSAEAYDIFLKFISGKFSYININLNLSAEAVSEKYRLKPKKNLFLDLNSKYERLKKDYSENHKRNIKKALRAGIILNEEIGLKDFQTFYLGNVNRKKENFKIKHEKIFIKLTQKLIENKSGQIISAISGQGELLAACLLLFHKRRIINIINTSSPAGKNSGASRFLFDEIIRKYSSSESVLDFEGSSIPGVAHFYERFGAQEEIFYNYHPSIIRGKPQPF